MTDPTRYVTPEEFEVGTHFMGGCGKCRGTGRRWYGTCRWCRGWKSLMYRRQADGTWKPLRVRRLPV